MILHLGVVDLPYSNPPTKRHRSKVPRGAETTGDVAGWLETRYHVMENFYELHKDDIAADLEDGLAGALENILTGAAPFTNNPFGSAESKIEERFRDFLTNREMETIGYPGVPTQAALDGVSHRFKNPYKKRAPRPSFIDTGLYQSSEKTWITVD